MSNLLPPHEKRALLREYRLRMGIVFLAFVSVFGMIGVVSLLPSLVRVHALIAAEEQGVTLEEQALERLGATALRRSLREADEELAVFGPLLGGARLAAYIRTISRTRSDGVSITSIHYDPEKGEHGTLVVGGTAALRDDLTAFVASLRSVEEFSAVELPIADLAREREAKFTMTVTLKGGASARSVETPTRSP